MSEPIRRLLRQGSLYAVGNLLMKVAGFLLAILYLNPAYLSQTSFGLWGTLDAFWKVLVPLLGLGMTTGLLKFWAEPEFEDDRDALGFTALAATGVVVLVGLAVFVVSAPWLADALLGEAAPPDAARLMRLLGLLVAFKTLYGVPAALIRIRERAGLYVLAIGGEMLVLLGGTYYMLVVRGAGLRGVVTAHVAASALSAVVLVVGVFWTGRRQIRLDLLGRLVRFGVPLAAAGVATLLLNLGDRFLLLHLADADTTAVYDWSGRLGSLLYLLFVSSFNAAFSVLGVKALRGDATQTGLHRRIFRHFAVGTGWAALGLSLVAFDGTRLISPNPAFLAAETLVLPIAIGYLFYGLYFLMVNILYVGDQTRSVAMNIVLATALNVALNVVLIPSFGAMGAAAATLLSYGALLALTARIVSQTAGTRFDWSILARVLVLVGGLYALGHLSVEWATAPRIAWRIGLIAAFVPLVVVLRLYEWEEVKSLSSMLLTWRRSSTSE